MCVRQADRLIGIGTDSGKRRKKNKLKMADRVYEQKGQLGCVLYFGWGQRVVVSWLVGGRVAGERVSVCACGAPRDVSVSATC